jgi:hypothetical protein
MSSYLLETYIKRLLETNYAMEEGSTFDYDNKTYKVNELIKVMQDHKKYPVEEKSVKELIEKNRNEDPWTWEGTFTFGEYLEHYDRALESDLKYPIIMTNDGKLLDGNHRLLKAYIEKKDKIKVQVCHDIGKKSCGLKSI